MFFNPYDVVEAQDQNYLVIGVENKTLILLDVQTMKHIEVDKSLCKRIKTMADIRNKAVFDASTGVIDRIKARDTLMSTLDNCKWSEGASLDRAGNTWLYEAIRHMDLNNSFDDGILDNFYSKVGNLTKSNNRISLVLSGNYCGTHISIKLTVVSINGALGITHVKRIFGDDGIFGNIQKPTTPGQSKTPLADIERTASNSTKSRLAS